MATSSPARHPMPAPRFTSDPSDQWEAMDEFLSWSTEHLDALDRAIEEHEASLRAGHIRGAVQ